VPGLRVHHEDPTQPVEVQYGPAHAVTLVAGGTLRDIAGRDRIEVNSLHHQGIRTLGAGLVEEARADDGLIEAFRVRDAQSFALAVQWHPEWKASENTFSSALFAAFGAAARQRAEQRRR
jgi:putative glutamine amidotransferase